MDLSNLSSGLFGYKKMAVANYISSLESEYNQKIQDLQKESTDTQTTLRDQIEALRAKQEEEVKGLQDKIEALTRERDSLRRSNDTIADTLLDAQQYANDLRDKANEKAAQRDKEHMETLTAQQAKLQVIDSKLRCVLGEISGLLQTASDQLTEKAADLIEAEDIIAEEKGLYETEEEKSATAVEEETAEEDTAEEAVGEETAEAIEEAEADGLSAEEAAGEEAEAKEEADPGVTYDEAVSRFTQAAGEIAGKLQ